MGPDDWQSQQCQLSNAEKISSNDSPSDDIYVLKVGSLLGYIGVLLSKDIKLSWWIYFLWENPIILKFSRMMHLVNVFQKILKAS